MGARNLITGKESPSNNTSPETILPATYMAEYIGPVAQQKMRKLIVATRREGGLHLEMKHHGGETTTPTQVGTQQKSRRSSEEHDELVTKKDGQGKQNQDPMATPEDGIEITTTRRAWPATAEKYQQEAEWGKTNGR